MQRKWRITTHDQSEIDSLRQAAGLPSIVAQLLIGRGVHDPQAVKSFLDPKLTQLRDPEQLPGIQQATSLISAAIKQRQRIVIYGDYDADGITGTAVLYRCLKLLGADVGYHIPNRLDDGYGLNHAALEKLASEGASVIVTVDCGIASLDEAETAERLGLQLVVTDHHLMAERLPVAAAIVHPMLPGHDYPFSGLAGAGVAFKLAWALCQQASGARRVTPAMKSFLLQAVGLAAIGTVADMVPLLDENRPLVHHGLLSLLHRPVPGMAQLLKATSLDQKQRLGSEDIGFTIAPRLNAAGRLGQAVLAVELLTTDNAQRISSLTDYLGELNKSRESLERSVYLAANKQALAELDSGREGALVLAGHGWHAGVIGIVAGRLAEKFHRPVLLAALDEMGIKPGMGSARSIPGFNIASGLAACGDRLISHGGHAAAAGFKVNERELDALRSEFCEYASSQITAGDQPVELRIDAEVPFSALTRQAVGQIERLAPFGQGNPRPLLCSSQIELAQPPKLMGAGDRHLDLRLKQHGVNLRGVAFGRGEWAAEMEQVNGPVALAFRPVINSFRGRHNVEIHVEDWQVESQDSTLDRNPETALHGD